MKRIFLLIILIATFSNSNSQEIITNKSTEETVIESLTEYLSAIEINNLRLKAMRDISNAQKLSNKTGLYPENPNVEFNYLWGNQANLGNRKDFRIVQSFDFPSSYFHKSNIADLRNRQSDHEYQKEYLLVMSKARQLYIENAYLNRYIKVLTIRAENSKKLAEAYEAKLNAGEANVLEYNKARLNHAHQQLLLNEQLSRNNILLSELAALNGGNEIRIANVESYMPLINSNFEEWYKDYKNSNPEIQWILDESEINIKQVKLSNSMALPKFSAGYMSESLPDERFDGLTMGITIPLWENRNVVKASKIRSTATQELALDMQQQFYFDLKSAHTKAISSISNAKNFSNEVEIHANEDFLTKAFNSGEISLIQYLTELAFYYDNIDRLLLLEMEAGLDATQLLYYDISNMKPISAE